METKPHSLNNSRLAIILGGVAALLMIPLLAMQFIAEVNWSLSDFIVMGVLLLAAALTGDYVWRKVENRTRRWVLLGVVAAGFLLIWAEIAVGVIGTPFGGS